MEAKELKAMTPKEVPKTVCAKTSSGTPTTFLKIAKKTGMMIIPPPIPKSPAKIPEKIPSKKYKKVLLTRKRRHYRL